MTTNEQQTQLLLLLEAIGRWERANLKTMIWGCVRLPLYLLNACLPIKHVVTVMYAPLMFVSIVSTRPRTKSKDETKAPLQNMGDSFPLSTHLFYSSNWLWLLGKPTTSKRQSVSQKAHNFEFTSVCLELGFVCNYTFWFDFYFISFTIEYSRIFKILYVVVVVFFVANRLDT